MKQPLSTFRIGWRRAASVGLCYAAVTLMTGACIVSESMIHSTVAAKQEDSKRLTLWYTKPAASGMNEALPIGNGRIGGLVYGGASSERIVFNEDSLWTGDTNPSGVYESMGAYQMFSEILLELPSDTDVSDYYRDLDLAHALAHVRYTHSGVHFTREYFVSHPAQVLVVQLNADKAGSYTGVLRLKDAHGAHTVAADTAKGVTLTIAGSLSNGLRYEQQLFVYAQGGSLHAEGDTVKYEGCNSLTLLTAAATNYVMDPVRNYQGADPHSTVSFSLSNALAQSYDSLKATHIADYRELFDRVKFHLTSGEATPEVEALPTDARKLLAAKTPDPALEEMLFQYGRYLLICSSRPGSLPANLQGIWNDSNTPPWSSDYHANINVQMNYWPAEVAGLSECHTPLFDLVDSQLSNWRIATQAASEYKLASGATVRGWAIRTSHNITGGMGWNWDKTANAWYCQHFWEHYAFSGDKRYLKAIAYPAIKETCEFWEDHLKALPDGRLVVPNGWSPEHGPVEDGCSYNQEIVWDLFTNYVHAADVLKIDPAYRAKIAAMRDRLVTPKIGRWGQLQEWMEDRDDEKDHHRHTSHLFGVFPGHQFSVTTTPALAAAAKKSLIARSDSDDVREWSFAWRTALYARLADGDAAYGQLRQLFSSRNSCPNLFGLHPPMQIDGNFGITAGIAEMLLQSQSGEIQLLPALPTVWKSGKVTGLHARGGFVVDQTWENGQLTDIEVHSTVGGNCHLRYGTHIGTFETKPGKSYHINHELKLL